MKKAFEGERIDFGADIKEGCTLVIKRFWAPAAMLARGMITDDLYAAAKRLRDDYYAGQAGKPGGREAYAKACRAVGTTSMPVLAWAVLSHGTVMGWAECKGIEVAQATGQVVQGLERLEKHYFLEN